MKIALIGYGYWGEKLARVINSNKKVELKYICDLREERLFEAEKNYPEIIMKSSCDSIFKDEEVELVVIATPSDTHYSLSKLAILNNKHVWVEKPMTIKVEDSLELLSLAKKKSKQLHVDHTYLFAPEVLEIKRMINDNKLGNLVYFDSVRINLGLFQKDVNVIYDLAPHDLSILLFLIDEQPHSVQATGKSLAGTKHENIAYIHLDFPSGLSAHCHVNWLSPVKIRKIIIAGDKQMITYDDTVGSEKLKIYDKGVNLEGIKSEDLNKARYNYRFGNTVSPYIEQEEPLSKEFGYIVDKIKNNNYNQESAQIGYNVVKIIDAAMKSISNNSSKVLIS